MLLADLAVALFAAIDAWLGRRVLFRVEREPPRMWIVGLSAIFLHLKNVRYRDLLSTTFTYTPEPGQNTPYTRGMTNETFRGKVRNAYQGIAYALVQATGPGTITVTASATGLTGSSATIQASAGTANAMSGNRINYNDVNNIVKILVDGGGIYTLSNQGSGSQMEYNYIHDFQKLQWADYGDHGLYLDEQTSGYTVSHNVLVNCPAISTNHPGANTMPDNAGTLASTISGAGIEPAYVDIKKDLTIPIPAFASYGTGGTTGACGNTSGAGGTGGPRGVWCLSFPGVLLERRRAGPGIAVDRRWG